MDLLISSDEFLKQMKAKGIDTTDMGWNPDKRKLGYCKTRSISKSHIILECPRGFMKLNNYTTKVIHHTLIRRNKAKKQSVIDAIYILP